MDSHGPGTGPPSPLIDATSHHSLPAHEVVLLLETDATTGLSDAEATARLDAYGANVLPEARTGGAALRFLRQFHNPLIYVLLAAAAVTVVLGEWVDAGVILAVVLVNAVVGFVQESRAESALDALRTMVRTEAVVRRDGHRRTVPSEAVVPGDVVLVEAGDKVPADLRLVGLAELRVDESALTGESAPVVKDEVALPAETPVADRHNMVYAGTLVTHGSGAGVVVATGAGTEVGEIHRLVSSADTLATPLTRKLARFSSVLTVVILLLAALMFGVGLLRGEDANEMFTASVALAVGAIPEGLPAAVTITLAIGVSRMARRRAVIRRMPAVETLGSTTVVCSDKTGTLTENRMAVHTIWTPDTTFRVTGSSDRDDGAVLGPSGPVDATSGDEALRWTLIAGAICNDARIVGGDGRLLGDPTEGALLVAARRAGFGPDLAGELARVDTIPFSSGRRYMLTAHVDDRGRRLVVAKGATERILDLCGSQLHADGSTTPLDPVRVQEATDSLAVDGLRVLATAMAWMDDPAVPFTVRDVAGGLTLTGLQAMLDPPRPEAVRAVGSCRTAGIDVKMITGDHAATAATIARRLGILGDPSEGGVLTGVDLAALESDEGPELVERTSVFARVSPEQKVLLVESLQARGHVVAMTGDGVNDAPALKQADIGVAMGRGGTEVAKEAADMVLTDDDFATIEAAVEEGRGVFDNLTKFIVWTLPTNMGEGLVILAAVLVGATLPVVPVQILWINMTTAVLLGLTLAFEPKEDGIMRRPPRDPRRPLLTGALVMRIGLVSALLVGGAWWLFEWERGAGATLAEARTAAVNVFVAVEAGYLVTCRSLSDPVWRTGWLSNRFVLAGIAVQAVGQLAITYLPAMNSVFGTAPIDVGAWLRILAIAAAAGIVVTIDKALRRRHGRWSRWT